MIFNNGVVIIGGGPVGIALGIELGLLNVKTLIIEKHTHPQMLPKAQLLNPRSMEFFRRWGISQILASKRLLPEGYPLRSTWCSGLAGKVYSSIDASENTNQEMSPESYQRIPLWITEEVLRKRVNDFKSVQLIKDSEVIHIEQNSQHVVVTAKNCTTHQEFSITSPYVVGCDGARSITRQMAGIEMQTELPGLRMINVMFSSLNLKEKMTVPKSILYYNLTLPKPAALGCVDYKNGLWYAAIAYPGKEALNKINISTLLDQVAGFPFAKKIKQASFWSRQAQIAKQFRKNRIFLAGDAAHVLPPTGGHGLNTGLGDTLNLAWKLAAVLQNQAGDKLLDSYETERKSVAVRNINIAKRNAEDAAKIREQYPLETAPQAFAQENERIAKQHAISPGIALGYCYHHSPIIFTTTNPHDDNPSLYQPAALPGFFTPHFFIQPEKSLYDLLQANYTLLIKDSVKNLECDLMTKIFSKKSIPLKILTLSQIKNKNLYPSRYYLLRPDWHIAWSGETIPPNLEEFINYLMPN
jgi:2-polyprenyl-6-methoxyphenol hydroxylase-like FAD-dependent oxidoreductase